MKSYAFFAIALTTAAAGCKTAGSNSALRETGGKRPAGGLHCTFHVPNTGGDAYEVWATPSGGQLVNVEERFTSGRNGQPGEINNIGTAEMVRDDSMNTKDGKPGIRGIEKDLVSVNFEDFSCFSLSQNADRTGYLCLGREGSARSTSDALWVSNYSPQKYENELTLLGTSCANN